MSVCFCTLAIHAPYRRRARLLAADLLPSPFLVLTDDPGDFADLPICAELHAPTGPMAVDYLHSPPAGHKLSQEAYHDKRFVLERVLREYDTAIFLDADARLTARPSVGTFQPGLTLVPGNPESVSAHLKAHGSWRQPYFVELAQHLGADPSVLDAAPWAREWCYAVTRNGREEIFWSTWNRAVDFMQGRGVFSGEGGVMGLVSAVAGWRVDYRGLAELAPLIRHEASGPKDA